MPRLANGVEIEWSRDRVYRTRSSGKARFIGMSHYGGTFPIVIEIMNMNFLAAVSVDGMIDYNTETGSDIIGYWEEEPEKPNKRLGNIRLSDGKIIGDIESLNEPEEPETIDEYMNREHASYDVSNMWHIVFDCGYDLRVNAPIKLLELARNYASGKFRDSEKPIAIVTVRDWQAIQRGKRELIVGEGLDDE